MVGQTHDPKKTRPVEEEALDRAMTSIDPILKSSLQRDQKRRRLRFLLLGGMVMTSIFGVLAFLTAVPGADNDATSDVPQDAIARGEQAADLSQEGWKLWQGQQPVKAEERFLAATALDAKNPHSWNGLGWSRIHQQRHKEAYEAFQRCLEIEANHGGALNGAGQTQLAQRNYAKAEEYFSRAGKDAPVALVGLARVQLLQKKFKPARKTKLRFSRQARATLRRVSGERRGCLGRDFRGRRRGERCGR